MKTPKIKKTKTEIVLVFTVMLAAIFLLILIRPQAHKAKAKPKVIKTIVVPAKLVKLAPLAFNELATKCAPDISPVTLKGIVSTESSYNQFAIGVVGGQLAHQPHTLKEALATAKDLEQKGFNFSMGLGQVNRYNLASYGETYKSIFEPCHNLKVAAAILKDCYVRAKQKISDEQQALRAAFSCYYSGNFSRGFHADKAGQPSYVQSVVNNASKPRLKPIVPAVRSQASDAVQVQTAKASKQLKNVDTSKWVTFADMPKITKAEKVSVAKAVKVEVQEERKQPFVQLIN